MNTKHKKLIILASFCFIIQPIFIVHAEMPAAEEWIDIEVVINVLDCADASKIDDAL